MKIFGPPRDHLTINGDALSAYSKDLDMYRAQSYVEYYQKQLEKKKLEGK